MKYDYLIVGSGLFGSIFAYEANKVGKKCLVIEKRSHIGGNIYTENVEGIQVHKYGAHIFHTSNKEVWQYINQFAEFNRYTNSPVARYKDELYNMPFNMNTFNKLWGVITPEEAKKKIEEEKKEAGITEPKNLEEQAISLVGKTIYEKLVKGYTEKQWGKRATELPSFIIKRLPVRFIYDNNYFNDKYQGIPIGGYTQIIEKMLEGIDIKLNCDFFENNEELKNVAEKIIDYYNSNNRVVVVLSAQGKTTDNLIGEVNNLTQSPNKRELDALLSVGEQISITKMSILLNSMGYPTISLLGWQVGIFTDEEYSEAKIEKIAKSRLEKELNEGKIVIIAGFQGIDDKNNITTLGRGGSDTTAIAIAATLGAKKCYIYSDVEGVYTADPKKIANAKQLDKISYEEMREISGEGAKVLHNRCVTIAEKFNVPIETKSTFSNKKGTIICNSPNTICGDADMNNNKNAENLEAKKIKSIVRNKNLSRVSIIGYGCTYDNKILSKVFKFIIEKNLKIFNINIDECKITINFKEEITDSILQEFHDVLF